MTVPSPVITNSEGQMLWMMYDFLLMILSVSLQSLWPLNGHLRYVQRRLILFSEIFRNSRNVDNVKNENTLVTYVQITLLLYFVMSYIQNMTKYNNKVI